MGNPPIAEARSGSTTESGAASAKVRFPLTEIRRLALGNDRSGASGRVPAAEAECPLSLLLGDLRADAAQRARSADGLNRSRGNLWQGKGLGE
jgi:hypothetical protein